MKLINADYLTGRIFTEADLTNAHTCYESIMAIIKSMESDDVLDKIRAEIEKRKLNSGGEPNRELAFNVCLQIIDKYKASPAGAERSVE